MVDLLGDIHSDSDHLQTADSSVELIEIYDKWLPSWELTYYQDIFEDDFPFLLFLRYVSSLKGIINDYKLQKYIILYNPIFHQVLVKFP